MRRGGFGLIAALLVVVGGGIAAWAMMGTSDTPSSASFGFQDWLVRCQTFETKVGCGMSQKILDKQSGRPVVQVHLGLAPSGEDYQLVVVMPLGIAVANGATLQAGEFKRTIAFTQCLPGGCVAPTAGDAALLDALSSAESAHVTVVDRTGQAVAVPFSPKGFVPAFAKLKAQGGIATNNWWAEWSQADSK